MWVREFQPYNASTDTAMKDLRRSLKDMGFRFPSDSKPFDGRAGEVQLCLRKSTIETDGTSVLPVIEVVLANWELGEPAGP